MTNTPHSWRTPNGDVLTASEVSGRYGNLYDSSGGFEANGFTPLWLSPFPPGIGRVHVVVRDAAEGPKVDVTLSAEVLDVLRQHGAVQFYEGDDSLAIEGVGPLRPASLHIEVGAPAADWDA